MATNKRPRSPDATEGHALDLKLLCAKDEAVLVSSTLLRHATRNSTVSDIINKLIAEHPDASADTPMELPVPEDSAVVWQVVWRIIEDPLTEEGHGLRWENLEQTIKLADKYQLPLILQACELFIVTAIPDAHVLSSTKSPFGLIREQLHARHPAHALHLELSFLELLLRVHMHRAYKVMTPLYMRQLHNMLRNELRQFKLRQTGASHIKAVLEALTAYSSSAAGSRLAAQVLQIMHEQFADAIACAITDV